MGAGHSWLHNLWSPVQNENVGALFKYNAVKDTKILRKKPFLCLFAAPTLSRTVIVFLFTVFIFITHCGPLDRVRADPDGCPVGDFVGGSLGVRFLATLICCTPAGREEISLSLLTAHHSKPEQKGG